MRLINVYEVPEAVGVLYRLLKERAEENDPYINISHRVLPSWAQHNEFFFSHPFAIWYLIKFGVEWLGYISVTHRNEVGIVLFRKFRDMGYGTTAVKMLIEMVPPLPAIPSKCPGHFVANINPKNKRSIRMFESLGFQHVQNTYALLEKPNA